MKGQPHEPDSPGPKPKASGSRRSISLGDFKRAGAVQKSEPPSAAATAPSSKLVTPSSSMEFEAARRRLLEVEERQRVILEMESRLQELHDVFVQSEQEVAEHGELVAHIAGTAQQGELYVAENGRSLKKKTLKFKKHRPTIVFASMLGLRTCLPWPVKLK
ncbi:TMF-regulated nuclear protein 1-like [Amia ocellicauda]|uniref:TMF-regulated nuclear protein 1-like n=1 Tax=Amia ocellicauda TaxID=2972642 RepID=UPI00346470C7